MCWQLAVAAQPATDPAGHFRRFGGGPVTDAAVVALFTPGDECRWLGSGCACSLYRTANEADRLRRRAEKRRWPAALLRRRAATAGDWVGLDPAVRDVIAAAAEQWGRVGLFLWWDDGRTRPTATATASVDASAMRAEPDVVVPGRLVTVTR